MASKSARESAISRATSPMLPMEENLAATKAQQDKKISELKAAQQSKSLFLIGSIEEVNQKISSLGEKLQSYHGLVAESRASDVSDDYRKMMSSPNSEKYQKKVKTAKEINQFAGLYSMKATFIPGVSDRVKNISKISMKNDTQSLQKDKGKPKFIELHTYPGYDAKTLTTLPHGIKALDILTKVADAQTKLQKKVAEMVSDSSQHYRPEFDKLFFSPMSQAILQDTFWWFFLEKFQSTKHYQVKLFNRVAHNYVQLMNFSQHPQFKEAFLSDYPMLLTQALYAAFCHCFPDSYRQLDEQFKEDLTQLVYDWVTGIRPVPRIWLKWNLHRIEPDDIIAREEIMQQTKSKGNSSVLNFDFLDSLPGRYTESQSTLHGSVTSLSSMRRGNRRNRRHRGSNTSLQSSNGSDGQIKKMEHGASAPTPGGEVEEKTLRRRSTRRRSKKKKVPTATLR